MVAGSCLDIHLTYLLLLRNTHTHEHIINITYVVFGTTNTVHTAMMAMTVSLMIPSELQNQATGSRGFSFRQARLVLTDL